MENQIIGGDATKLTIATILSNGVQFGSTALGVQSVNSDWDVYMLKSTFQTLFKKHKNIEEQLVGSHVYSNLLPPNDTCKILYKYKTVDNHYCDILVVEKQETLELMKLVMQDMEKIPQYMLKDKAFRIAAFQEAQIHYGFVPVENVIKQNVDSYTLKIYPVKQLTPSDIFDRPINYQDSKNPFNLLAVALYSYLGRKATVIDFGVPLSVVEDPNTVTESFIKLIIHITSRLENSKDNLLTIEQYNNLMESNNSGIYLTPIKLIDYSIFADIEEKDISIEYMPHKNMFRIGASINGTINYLEMGNKELALFKTNFPILYNKLNSKFKKLENIPTTNATPSWTILDDNYTESSYELPF